MRYLITGFLLFGFAAVSVSADESAAVIGKLTLIHSGSLSAEDQEFVVKEVKSHEYKSTNLTEIASFCLPTAWLFQGYRS